ncbi:cytochrome P450 [Phyllosticta citriasiana]
MLREPRLCTANMETKAVYILFCTVVVVLAAVARAGASKKLKRPRLGGPPLLGDAAAFANNPVAAIKQSESQCGPIFAVRMLFRDNVWLRGNKLNKFYAHVKEDTWSFGGGMGLFLNKVVVPGYFENLRTLIGSLNRCINKNEALNHYAGVAREEASKSVDDWGRSGTDIELFESVSYLVHRIIVRCLMGPDFYEKNVDDLYHLLHAVEADIGNILHFLLPDWVPHPAARRLWKKRDEMQEIFRQRLREREQNPEKWADAEDYISHTLRDKVALTLKEYFPAHHTLLMFAAHTSTVASISWTITELLRNPDILEKLRHELSTVDNVHTSPLLVACLKETGRHYSGVNMLRLSHDPVTLPESDVVVPAGSIVSISPYVTHHDPDNFARPYEWLPERWIDGKAQLIAPKAADPSVFLGFGQGSHRCPGEKMAGYVTREVVGFLVKECTFDWGKPGRPEKFDLDFAKIGSPWLKGDVAVRVSRKPAA